MPVLVADMPLPQLEVAASAASSAAATTGAATYRSQSTLILGEGAECGEYSFRSVMTMRTGSLSSSLIQRANQLKFQITIGAIILV